MVIAEFLASIGFQTDEKSMKAALTKLKGFTTALSVVTGAAVAGIMKVAQGEVELAKKADSLGVPIKKLEELNYVAEQTGASAEGVAAALGGLRDKYPYIKDTSTLLERVGSRMRGMNEQAAKLYAKRMGIDPSLVPMLTKDVGELKKEFAAMYDVAGRDAKQAAADSAAFLGELDKLKSMAGMLVKAVGGAFLGKLRGYIESLRKTIMENFAKIKRIFETVIGVVLRIAGVVGAFVRRVVKWAAMLIGWYDNLSDSQKKIVQGLALMLAAWKLLNAGFLMTPLGAIIAGLTAIVALVDDYLTYMEGGESYFDWGPWEATIEGVKDAIVNTVRAVVDFYKENERLIKAFAKGIAAAMAAKGILKAVGAVFKLLGGGVFGVARAFKLLWGILRANPLGIIITLAALVIEYWEPIKEFFAHLWDGIAEKFPNFAAWAENMAGKIREFFGPAIDWIKKKFKALTDWMPDSIKKMIGISTDKTPADESGGTPEKAVAPAVPAQNLTPPQAALTPSPMQAKAAVNSSKKEVNVKSKTEITVTGTQSPEQVAGKVKDAQDHAAADMARNMAGAVR